MTKTNTTRLMYLLTQTQEDLLVYLEEQLVNYGYQIQSSDYALAGLSTEINAPTVVAHLDTRNTLGTPTFSEILQTEEKIYLEKEANSDLECLGADDRTGIESILSLLDKGMRPNVLFTTDEEMGCLGTRELLNKANEWSWLADTCMFIQIDRGRHEGSWKEMVFYSYNPMTNPDIFDKLSEHYDLATGSNTDVRLLGEYFKKPLVNLSASYCYEHRRDEYINLIAFEENQEAFESFVGWLSKAPQRSSWTYQTDED